jgi:PAT family beta-lactamase induction signal transducer AmpG
VKASSERHPSKSGEHAPETVDEPPAWIFFILGRATAPMQGFLQVAFPYIAVRHGASVAGVASIIAAASLAIMAKLVWSPVLDMVGTLRGWIVLGGMATMILLTALIFAPVGPANIPLLIGLAFAASTAAQVANAAVSGLLVLTMPPCRLGVASSYLQAGDMLVQGISGGLGLWIATSLGTAAAAGFFDLTLLPSMYAVILIREPYRTLTRISLGHRLRTIGEEILELARAPRSRWVIICFLTPIGAGSASFLWTAIAPEWHASAAQVAAVNGLGAALCAAVGAGLFARFLSRIERIAVYLLIGTALCAAAALLALLPRSASMFMIGTLIYTVLLGAAWSSYGAVQYDTVAGGAAATKNAILNSIGNVPLAYMQFLLGQVHDRWSSGAMFWFEALFTLGFVVIFALWRPHDGVGVIGVAASKPYAMAGPVDVGETRA